MSGFDIAVDFMDMTNDRRLWSRLVDVRAGLEPMAGSHVIVGGSDADPAVAKVLSIDPDGHIELQVLPGSVESHQGLLA